MKVDQKSGQIRDGEKNMQIVPGNSFAQSVGGSAAQNGVSATRPDAISTTAGTSRQADSGQAQAVQRIERPIPAEPVRNAAPGSVIDIVV
jgi:hypothetical protein